jgi:spore coat polysaccharide biosynthesis protein SpsF
MQKNKNAIIIVQCRYDSKRLPGKILKRLNKETTCLEYLLQRLGRANFNVIVATTDRDEDLEIVNACIKLKKEYKYLLECFTGSEKNIAKRLYEASAGYEYIVRVTGDDFFVDIETLNKISYASIADKIDYHYPKDLIRGCDCDVFKRDALKKAMEIYNTEDVESIEFLFMNDKFNTRIYKVPDSYINPDINLTVDTEEDWKVAHVVWENLSKINYHFTAWDVVSFLARNTFIQRVNKVPLVTVYTVYKDYPVAWLAEAIDSLNKQTFVDYEYILIDYGSKQINHFLKEVNNSEKCRTFFTDDMTFIESINFAIKKARGKYILRLDADDILNIDALEEMVNYIKEHNFYSAVIPDHLKFTDCTGGEFVPSYCDGGVENVMSCALIEKKKYSFVKFMEDQEFRDGTNLLKHFKEYDFQIGYLKKPVFYYRVHDKSLTHGTGRENLVKETDEIINGK